MTAGLAAIKFINTFDVQSYVEKMGKQILDSLQIIESKSRYIGDVRGIGMMFGVEYVKDRHNKSPYPQMAELVKKLCFENGLLVEIGGYYGNVVRLLPALIVTNQIVTNALQIFEKINIEASENSF